MRRGEYFDIRLVPNIEYSLDFFISKYKLNEELINDVLSILIKYIKNKNPVHCTEDKTIRDNILATKKLLKENEKLLITKPLPSVIKATKNLLVS